MPLRFEAAPGSAIDPEHGIKILCSRQEPGRTPDEIEYQYAIYKDGKRHGFGCLGISTSVVERDRTIRLFTLDLGPDAYVRLMLSLRLTLQIKDGELDFVLALTDGLLKVHLDRSDNEENVRYIALGMRDSLLSAGVPVPSDFPALPNGQLILAEAHVPAHP